MRDEKYRGAFLQAGTSLALFQCSYRANPKNTVCNCSHVSHRQTIRRHIVHAVICADRQRSFYRDMYLLRIDFYRANIDTQMQLRMVRSMRHIRRSVKLLGTSIAL
jgi:hypothetical protein